jgi:D-alanine-D-alanine ligase
MREIAEQARELAPRLRILFVTNLRADDLADLGPDGVVNDSQYYTQAQADEMIRSLRELDATVTPFFDERDFIAEVVREERPSNGKIEIVFTTAEGGTGSGRRALIPALCNLLSLPVVNSGAHASSIARHKFHANAVMRQVGVKVPGTWQYRDGQWIGSRPPSDTRVIVKPTYETMCIGIDKDSVRFVDADFDSYIEERHHAFRQSVLVQEFISGEEIGVPVVRIGESHALPPVAFRRASGEPFGAVPRTFEDEHIRGDMEIVPFAAPGMPAAIWSDAATLAFDALEMAGAGRIDLRLDADGRAWVFDTSECPPPLPGGSFALSMEQLGFDYLEMLALWIGISLLDFGLLQESDQYESSTHGSRRP